VSFYENAMVWSAIKYLDSSSDYRELLPDSARLEDLSFGPLILMADQEVGIRIRCCRAVIRMARRLRSLMLNGSVH